MRRQSRGAEAAATARRPVNRLTAVSITLTYLAALCAACVVTTVAHAKKVPSRGYEQAGGLAGALSHRERVLSVNRGLHDPDAAWRRRRAHKWIRAHFPVGPYDRIHRCEQPSGWHVPGKYPGGLGILYSSWLAARSWPPRLWWYPTNGAVATRPEQIVVAMRLHARYGWRPWSCASMVGLR